MTDTSPTEAPSLARLVKALVVAAGLAGVLLVLVVLPAEYNIDVTGFGRAVGLTVLSAPSTETAAQTAPEPSAAPVSVRDDRTVVDVPAGKGVEYKFRLRSGQKMTYSWAADDGALFYDFHGEPQGGAANEFESFAAGRTSTAKGTFTAPFEGTHGWYWKNSSRRPVQVTLETSGAYEIVGLK